MKIDSGCNLLLPKEMAQVADDICCYKANKSFKETLLSAFMAGMFISIAVVFYTTVTTGTNLVPIGWAKLIGGICFSLGLMLVVVCGADLFTSAVLTIIPKATGRISWQRMLRHWGYVYLGNFIGALFFVGLIWFSGQYKVASGAWGLNLLQFAEHKVEHSFVEAICLGILANLMVCLAVWMSYAGKTLMDKLFALILPIAMFVASGFEHSIANMFLIPLGIIIKKWAPQTFWEQVGLSPEAFPHLNSTEFLFNNLLPVTIGNIIGGAVLVGLIYWLIYLKQR